MARRDEESADSGEDIPFDKKTKDAPEEDDDEDEEEEEFAVEKIVSHKWGKSGKKDVLKYTVKWVGYDETTEEPEDNLDNCPDELDTYFKSIGGKPEPPSSAKKRSASEMSTTSRGRPSAGAGNKKAKTGANGKMIVSNDGSTWKAPEGSWEDHITAIDSMSRDTDGGTIAYIIWENGKKSKHQTKLLNQKCPQKMLSFYEAHLFFNPVPTDEASVRRVATPESPGSEKKGVLARATNGEGAGEIDDVDEDEEMEGVKAVASG